MEKMIMFAIKKYHFKNCCPRVGKNVPEIEKDGSDEASHQSDCEFLLNIVYVQDSVYINQIKNENSDWSVTLPLNGIPVSYKIDTGAQCNSIPLTILKKNRSWIRPLSIEYTVISI